MPDILSTGVSGLRAFQRALDVTSPTLPMRRAGVQRQRAELGTRVAEGYGNGFIGSGVNVNAITRSYDQLLTTQMRTASSSLSHLEAYASKAQKLNNLFADSGTGLSAAMQRFTNSVQGVSNDPTSTAARQVMLSEADGLKQRLQTYDRRLDEVETEINSQMASEVAEISNLAGRIAASTSRRGVEVLRPTQTICGLPRPLISDLSAPSLSPSCPRMMVTSTFLSATGNRWYWVRTPPDSSRNRISSIPPG